VRHRPRREGERLEEDAMTRQLVVEREPVARVAERLQAAGIADPVGATRAHRREGPSGAIHRLGRIAREQVLEVGEDELLVLLLVVEAELDARRGPGSRSPRTARASPRPRERDRPARSRGRVATTGRAPAADGARRRDVIRVEQHAERRIERHEALALGEDERLEEPGRVGEVPLDRARVGHRLERAVLGRERRGERLDCARTAA
jgi:hypothetical protein